MACVFRRGATYTGRSWRQGVSTGLFFARARTPTKKHDFLRVSACPRHAASYDQSHDTASRLKLFMTAAHLMGARRSFLAQRIGCVCRRGATYTGRSRCQGVSTGAFLTRAQTFFRGLPNNMFFGGSQPAPAMLLCTAKVTTRPHAFRFVS